MNANAMRSWRVDASETLYFMRGSQTTRRFLRDDARSMQDNQSGNEENRVKKRVRIKICDEKKEKKRIFRRTHTTDKTGNVEAAKNNEAGPPSNETDGWMCR